MRERGHAESDGVLVLDLSRDREAFVEQLTRRSRLALLVRDTSETKQGEADPGPIAQLPIDRSALLMHRKCGVIVALALCEKARCEKSFRPRVAGRLCRREETFEPSAALAQAPAQEPEQPECRGQSEPGHTIRVLAPFEGGAYVVELALEHVQRRCLPRTEQF